MDADDAIVAPVVDIQRFSIHDGPGIRSLVFLKGCNLHCVWCQNPESQEARPVVGFYANRCHRTFHCLDVCPDDAIDVDSFRIDYEHCSLCGKCTEVCVYNALKTLGEYLTPEQLLDRLIADTPYYRSGGGITFTGGEPTLYPDFMDRMLTLCREHGLHTNMETAGSFPFERWRPILSKLDLIYFDLKLMDAERHRKYVGGGYERIISNARLLVENGYPVEFRLALIPGFTDTPANLGAIADFLGLLNQRKIHLLRYHNMGEAKIDIINGRQPKLGLGAYSDEAYAKTKDFLGKNRIEILTHTG